MSGPGTDPGVDRAVRVLLPAAFAEVAGAVLMELMGPFEEEGLAGNDGRVAASGLATGGPAASGLVALVFYPPTDAALSLDELLAALPPAMQASGQVRLESRDVSRGWVEGWRDHFRPITVGGVRIRPPWEPAVSTGVAAAADAGVAQAADAGVAQAACAGVASPTGADAARVDVVINPGLGFGTGLHPTTRGTLRLLQEGFQDQGEGGRGPLVDAGTGSGILAIAAAKLGWTPVVAFDNDPAALASARENIEANEVGGVVEVHEADVAGAPADWFAGATVLANMTLGPVSALVRRLGGGAAAGGDVPAAAGDVSAGPGDASAAEGDVPAGAGHVPAGAPRRVVVSGILAGAQEQELLRTAEVYGLAPRRRVHEDEWVSLELLAAATRGGLAAAPTGGLAGPTGDGPSGAGDGG